MTRILIRLPSIEKLSFTTLSVLHTLSHNSPMRLTELTATKQVTQSAIIQLVTRLERDGLVERGPAPNDGRVVQVHITALGANVINSRRMDRTAQLSKFVEELNLGKTGNCIRIIRIEASGRTGKRCLIPSFDIEIKWIG
ncbi:MarR family winged helix-turn-helix transcriptional regulator [Paenibacillus brasilensis]|uniref:MarR family winged helix-turn-helix transcriptional regulator n=1 Tax=Paenibacillus brasilensis TaxID=128574 RepID=UPI001FCBE748|nr:MarR family transcriptional regulator [Paenibacillus brasilensis]